MDGDSHPPSSDRTTDDPRVTRLTNANPRYVTMPLTVPHAPSMTLGDVYYTLFRHKWKIILCSAIGLAAALALYRFQPPPYQSEAKLFIRYVTEGKALSAPGDDAKTISPQRGDTIINSELQILTSLDLAKQVATAIGPERILGKAGVENAATIASVEISKGLTV